VPPSVRLVHWHPLEAEARAEALANAGFLVDASPLRGGPDLRRIRQAPPDALAIDLSRMPSYGRDIAVTLRRSKATRAVPLVFLEGDPEKVARIRALLPDAVYTTWAKAPAALRRVIASPPARPVTPSSAFAAYSGVPLARKLGIGPGCVVRLVDPPTGFARSLAPLPEGATVRKGLGRGDLVVWFVRSRAVVARGVRAMGARAGRGGLWIAWPKKQSGRAGDLSQGEVRRLGLAAGLVDYKICSIDETWSGLRFARRARKKGV